MRFTLGLPCLFVTTHFQHCGKTSAYLEDYDSFVNINSTEYEYIRVTNIAYDQSIFTVIHHQRFTSAKTFMILWRELFWRHLITTHTLILCHQWKIYVLTLKTFLWVSYWNIPLCALVFIAMLHHLEFNKKKIMHFLRVSNILLLIMVYKNTTIN